MMALILIILVLMTISLMCLMCCLVLLEESCEKMINDPKNEMAREVVDPNEEQQSAAGERETDQGCADEE